MGSRPRGRRRRLIIAAVVVSAVVVLAPMGYAASVALHPYDSAPVPADCVDSRSQLPVDRLVALPSPWTGTGTLLSRARGTDVVLVAHDGQTPSGTTVLVVNRSRRMVVRSLAFPDDVLAVSIRDGVVYVFNDKLLSVVDARTGATPRGHIRIDNYRGLYGSGDHRRIQTTGAITNIGFHGRLFAQLHLRFTTVAFGCVISSG